MTILKSVTLHNPFFLAGKNFGNKLETGNSAIAIELIHTDEHEDGFEAVFVRYQGKTKRIPVSNVADMEAMNTDDWGIEFPTATEKAKTHAAQAPRGPAQVSSPMDHVFNGEGAGKTKQ